MCSVHWPITGNSAKAAKIKGDALASSGRYDTTFWLAPVRQRYIPPSPHAPFKLQGSTCTSSTANLGCSPIHCRQPTLSTQGMCCAICLPAGGNIQQSRYGLWLRLRGVFVFARCNCATITPSTHSSPSPPWNDWRNSQRVELIRHYLPGKCRNWPRARVLSSDTDWLPGSRRP